MTEGYTQINGMMWCTEHDDIADECNDGETCNAVLFDRAPDGTEEESCVLVPMFIGGVS